MYKGHAKYNFKGCDNSKQCPCIYQSGRFESKWTRGTDDGDTNAE